MKLSTQNHLTSLAFGHEESVRLLARAGFDAVDLSLFEMWRADDVWRQDDWRERAAALKKAAEECGVTFNQAHAPFPSSKDEEGFDEHAYQLILRAMEISSLVGVKGIVVHPRQQLPWAKNKEQLYRENLEFYRSLIPYCEKWNIVVYAENMWQRDKNRGYIVDSVCSQPEEFCRLLDELDSPWIKGCLDLGHCVLVGLDPADFIRAMGKDRLRALHVHDVEYTQDTHTMPYLRKQNWETITEALAEIGYEGDFTFEADSVYHGFPKELYEDMAVLLCKVGRNLISRIENR